MKPNNTKAIANNPYLDARREWNERYGDFIAQARNWRLLALGSLLVSAIACGGLAWVAGQSKITPYVVEVNGLGDAVPVAVAEKAATPDARIIRAQLARWIVNSRSIYFDAQAERQAIEQAYAMINRKSPAIQALIDFHKANDPFQLAMNENNNIQVESVLPISQDSYRIEWREEIRGCDGNLISNLNWQAVIGISISPPTDAKQVLVNPMGIYVNSISWSQRI